MALPSPSLRDGITAIATFALLLANAHASPPYKVDVTQKAAPEIATSMDHLLPATKEDYILESEEGPSISANYLVQFIEQNDVVLLGASKSEIENYRDPWCYVVVFRKKDGRYILRAGPIPGKNQNPLQAKTPKGYTDVEIPESMAAIIYSLWINTLLEVRYDRAIFIGIPHESSYVFSSYGSGLGELYGTTTEELTRANLPPKWLVDTGDALLAFAQDPKRDPKKMQATLTTTRDRLFRYLRWHGVQ